ncbi:MAG: DnaB-like helicase C-terminal domain-containing protein [Sulfuricurvum sp.]
MEELIKILQETYKGLDASDEELFHIAHTLLYRKEENVERLNTEIVIEDSDLELVQISIGDFIEYNNINEIDIPVHLLNNYYAETPSGMTRINAGVKKSKHDIIEIEFEDGTIQRVAEKHIYPQYDGVDKYADEVDYVITKNGKLTVKNKKFYSKDYVYDIGIANPHLYYTSDGILSHNSALMACIASNMVVSGKNVLYVTLEMSEEETAKRIDANILDIDINEFANTPIDTITKKFNSVKDKLGKLIIKEYPAGTFNTLHLEGLMAELATKGFIPDTIFIDYLGLMASSRTTLASSGGTYMYIKTIAEECHGFSKKYDLPVISASQLNRSAFGNVDVGMENVAESIGLAATADTMLAMIATDQMRDQNQVLIKFLKNRNTGMLDSIMLESEYPKMRYTDWEEEGSQYSQQAINTMVPEAFHNAGIDVGSFNFG